MLVLLGETRDEFGGSIWQQISGGGLSGLPPQVDLADEERLADFFVGNTDLTGAHDISEGGLAQTVVEMAFRTEGGVKLDLSAVHEDEFVALFSESASRAVVATTAGRVDAVLARAAEKGVPAAVIGETTQGRELVFGDVAVDLDELKAAWKATLPDLFGHAVGANSVVE